jgi:hypothetical protein
MPSSESGKIDWASIEVSSVASARSKWPDEVRDLTPWVVSNLGDLGKKLGLRLELVGLEMRVGTFRVDIAARDAAGRLVIIENQLGTSDHGHLGQILLYACEAKADVVIWLVANDVRRFVGGGIRPEHERALARLNEVFAGTIEFYGVEVALVSPPRRLGEGFGPLLPHMHVVIGPSAGTPTC